LSMQACVTRKVWGYPRSGRHKSKDRQCNGHKKQDIKTNN